MTKQNASPSPSSFFYRLNAGCRWGLLAGCFLFCLAVGIGWRLAPLKLAVSDDNFEKAVLLLSASRRTSFSGETITPDKNKLVRDAIRLGQRWDRKRGQTQKAYLLGADSFHFLERTRRIIEQGRISDSIRSGRYFHELMNAPLGYWEPFSLHPYAGAWWHRMLSSLKLSHGLEEDVGWFPLLLFGIGLVFFITTAVALKPDPLGLLAAGLVFSCAPIYVKRSAWGWYDNDPYQIIFPLWVVGAWLRLMTLPAITPMSVFVTAVVMTVGLVLYALFWQGWLSLWLTVAGLAVGSAFLAAVFRKSRVPSRGLIFSAVSCGLAVIVSVAVLSLVWGSHAVLSLCEETLTALKNFISPAFPLWPPLYNAVGELRPSSWNDLVFYLGGYPMAVFCLLGLIGCIRRCLASATEISHKWAGLFLILWWGIQIMMAKNAQRFLLMALVPSGLLAIEGASHMARCLRAWRARLFNEAVSSSFKQTHRRKIARSFWPVLIMGVFLLPFFMRFDATALISRPYNDTWHRALVLLNRISEPHAIVNTWWPPGHFVKATARRRVIFDGATINKPRAYWMAQAFTSNDETYSAGVLRMLNNSGNTIVGFLNDMTPLNLPDTIAFLKQWLRLPSKEAQRRLQSLPWPSAVKDLLWEATRKPPLYESYLVVPNELFEKSLQLYFIAGWDFSYAWNMSAKTKAGSRSPSVTDKDFVPLVWRMRGGPVRLSPILPGTPSADGTTIVFEKGGIIYRPHIHIMTINSDTYGHGHPRRVVTLVNNKVTSLPQPAPQLSYTAVVTSIDGRWEAVLMDEAAADSLLTRLFLFNGKGLTHFHHRATIQSAGGRTRIKIFSVSYDMP